jgi:hypothetical protein
MPGLPDLQAQIAALQAARADMTTKLDALSDRLDEVAGYAISGAPAHIDATTALAAEVTQVVEALSDWSEGAVSRTYLDSLLPPP